MVNYFFEFVFDNYMCELGVDVSLFTDLYSNIKLGYFQILVVFDLHF